METAIRRVCPFVRTLPIDFALLGRGTELNKIEDDSKIKREKNIDCRGQRHIVNVWHLSDHPSFSLPTTFNVRRVWTLPDSILLTQGQLLRRRPQLRPPPPPQQLLLGPQLLTKLPPGRTACRPPCTSWSWWPATAGLTRRRSDCSPPSSPPLRRRSGRSSRTSSTSSRPSGQSFCLHW